MKNIIFLTLTVFVFSCNKEPGTSTFPEDPSIIQDQYGRQLILHGLNTSNYSKYAPDRQPWIMEHDVEREVSEFGFNFVRYLIFWDGLEPVKNEFDEVYLDKIEQRVNWYTSRGMYVMLDMHQDLYSANFGEGDGAPEWACRTDGKEQITFPAGTPWWLKNIDPAVMASWVNFWQYTDHKDLQDHYLLTWQKVLDRFKNNPYVLGYDIMNEPYGGDIIKVFLTGDFERKQLSAFYNKLISYLRNTEPDKYFFYEPGLSTVSIGGPSFLSKISDTRYSPRLSYSPHCYPLDLHEGNGYTVSAKQQLKDWEQERKKDIQTQGNIPLLCGEFGISPSLSGFSEYLNDINNMFDSNQWNWAYYSNDQGGWSPLNADRTETPILQYLIRTYPKAIAGKVKSFSFDPVSKRFRMKYISNKSIIEPTEIFIPNRHYPDGYTVVINGTSNYNQEYDTSKQVLKIMVLDHAKEISVEIAPK